MPVVHDIRAPFRDAHDRLGRRGRLRAAGPARRRHVAASSRVRAAALAQGAGGRARAPTSGASFRDALRARALRRRDRLPGPDQVGAGRARWRAVRAAGTGAPGQPQRAPAYEWPARWLVDTAIARRRRASSGARTRAAARRWATRSQGSPTSSARRAAGCRRQKPRADRRTRRLRARQRARRQAWPEAQLDRARPRAGRPDGASCCRLGRSERERKRSVPRRSGRAGRPRWPNALTRWPPTADRRRPA